MSASSIRQEIVGALGLGLALHLGLVTGCGEERSETSIMAIDGPAVADGRPAETKRMDLMPDPWPLAYWKHPGLDDRDARSAQMIAGLDRLVVCTDVLVTRPENATGREGLILIVATGIDGRRSLWYVEVDAGLLLGELAFLSADLADMALEDMHTGHLYTARMLEDAAISESCREQVTLCAEALGIETAGKGLGDLWRKVKDKWNSLSVCEQVHVIAGRRSCTAAGMANPLLGAACGAGFWISAAVHC